jgi:RNA polymerase sigma factor (sigma-70 family)
MQLGKFNFQSRFGTWAQRVGMNEAFTAMRQTIGLERRTGGPVFSLDVPADEKSAALRKVADPRSSYAAVDARADVLALMRKMPATQRAILEARYLREEDSAAIAEQSGKTRACVKTIIHRSLRRARATAESRSAQAGDETYRLPLGQGSRSYARDAHPLQ